MAPVFERLQNLKAADVMSRQVVALNEGDSVASAIETLRRHEISGAAVIDEAGRLCGIASMADFVTHDMNREGTHVRDRMTRRVVSVTQDAPLIAVARMLCDSHRHRMPVVESSGRMVGMITTMDILSALVNAFDESRIVTAGEP
jgi:CBS domain-containing membrane protein